MTDAPALRPYGRHLLSCEHGDCAGGPIVAIYPDGVWYHHADRLGRPGPARLAWAGITLGGG